MPDIPPNKVAQAEPGANDFETWDDFDDKKWRYLVCISSCRDHTTSLYLRR